MGYQPLSLQRNALITLAGDSYELIEIRQRKTMETRDTSGFPIKANAVLAGITADRRLVVEGADVSVRSRGSRGKDARPGSSANAVPSPPSVCTRVLSFSRL